MNLSVYTSLTFLFNSSVYIINIEGARLHKVQEEGDELVETCLTYLPIL
jgi:hypothetical protein